MELKRSSRIPLLLEYVENRNVQGFGCSYAIWFGADPLYFNARHSGQSNVLLADFHVDSYPMHIIRDEDKLLWRFW